MSKASRLVVSVVQRPDDGLEMYLELFRHQRAPALAVSSAADALTAAPDAAVIATAIRLSLRRPRRFLPRAMNEHSIRRRHKCRPVQFGIPGRSCVWRLPLGLHRFACVQFSTHPRRPISPMVWNGDLFPHRNQPRIRHPRARRRHLPQRTTGRPFI